MKIATWNVNSIAARLPHVTQWVSTTRPDVLCLQEIKCVDSKFPTSAFTELGYEVVTFGQPTYNGVAILSLHPIQDVQKGFPGDSEEAQKRMLAVTVKGVRVIDVYIPNGSEVGSEKYQYKLKWLAQLHDYFATACDAGQKLVLCGDYNIAPGDADVHDPIAWYGQVLCSQPERDALQKFAAWGLTDLFRQHHKEAGLYSWWDYRGGGFPRNHGLRIDHLWATAALAQTSKDCWIDVAPRRLERPSDHAPVIAEFDLAE
jgi:exodeoxyribonuclease III